MPVSVTKYVQVERPVAEAYTFLADPATMPKWAIHNVNSIKPVGNGRWEMDTPRGKRLSCSPLSEAQRNPRSRFHRRWGRFLVGTARAVPIADSASLYMITLTKPDGIPMGAFEGGLKLMDEELTALKACIEAL